MRKAAVFFGLSSFLLTAVLTAQQAGQQQQTGQQQAGQQQPQGQRGGGRQADPRTRGGGDCSASKYNCIDTPNPLPKADTVWLEEMTWMDVRDAMAAGKKTIIIATGGIEPNGPWLALGKHNFVLRSNCDAIARKLGDALCAPIVPFVPEGRHEPASSHMLTMGTISLTEETFAALLSDIVVSFKVHGFKNIILIGDSGGNPRGMNAVATKYNTEWNGDPVVAHVAAHYNYSSVDRLLTELGVIKEGQPRDGLHDDPGITLNIMATDPKMVRWDERVKAGLATINGVSIADKAKALDIAKKIVEMRATNTAAAIKAAIANKGKTGGN